MEQKHLAVLYKAFLYEKGGHFKLYKNKFTEKEVNMQPIMQMYDKSTSLGVLLKHEYSPQSSSNGFNCLKILVYPKLIKH